ncbi:MAG: DUF6731 family protein [Streptococcus infantarius]|nr:DUF6731 family protein [Streptococcus infantarius]
MAKSKQVRFYFHKVINEGKSFDLSEVFDEIAKNYRSSPDRYTFEIESDKYKLERLKQPNDTEPYYHLVVEELRDFNFPSKTKLTGESQDLGLAEDEFLGEKMSALYDSDNAIFMLQVNRNSISTNKFEVFLSAILEFLNYKDYDVRLPVIVQADAEKVAKSFTGYKHVAIRMRQDAKPTNKFDLISAISNAITSNKDSELFDVEISLTAKKDKSNGGEYLPDSIVKEVMSIGRDGITKLNVRGRNLDERLETVDLISNKLMETIHFQYDDKRTLNPASVFSEMSVKYSEIKYKVLRNK